MIIFDYNISKSWDANRLKTEWSCVDEMDLRYDFLIGDIFMQVGDCDFSVRCGWVPILDFVCSLKDITNKLCQHDSIEIEFEFTESESTIKFNRKGQILLVSASYVQCVSTVSFDEFNKKLDTFASKVIEDIYNDYPESKNNAWLNSFSKSLIMMNRCNL